MRAMGCEPQRDFLARREVMDEVAPGSVFNPSGCRPAVTICPFLPRSSYETLLLSRWCVRRCLRVCILQL